MNFVSLTAHNAAMEMFSAHSAPLTPKSDNLESFVTFLREIEDEAQAEDTSGLRPPPARCSRFSAAA